MKQFLYLLVTWLNCLTSAATSFYPAVEAVVGASAQIAAGPILGAVVGIVNVKQDPITGVMSGGSIALDTPVYRPASTKQFVLVADSPDLIYEAEADASVAVVSLVLTLVLVLARITHCPTRCSLRCMFILLLPRILPPARPLQIVGR